MPTIDFTDKELAQVWSIVAWFQDKRPVSTSLVIKLYPGADNQWACAFDEVIDERILEVANFLVRHRADIAERVK